MSAVDSTLESQNRALYDHRGRARSIVPGVAVSLLAVFGGLVLIGMTAFALRLDVVRRKPVSVDSDRYPNFASLPFVLDSRGTNVPVLAWTRRDGATYRSSAHLRRAVDSGEMPATDDDTAVSHGTAFLPDFSESDELASTRLRGGGAAENLLAYNARYMHRI